jgi:hypothetical protein
MVMVFVIPHATIKPRDCPPRSHKDLEGQVMSILNNNLDIEYSPTTFDQQAIQTFKNSTIERTRCLLHSLSTHRTWECSLRPARAVLKHHASDNNSLNTCSNSHSTASFWSPSLQSKAPRHGQKEARRSCKGAASRGLDIPGAHRSGRARVSPCGELTHGRAC